VTGVARVVKALIGLAVLVVLVVTVNGWYGDYKQAARTKSMASLATSSSIESTRLVPVAGGKKVSILIDGLVLRTTPATGAASVRTLKKGEQLILVGTVGSWLQLRDSGNGKIGYVASNSASVKVQK